MLFFWTCLPKICCNARNTKGESVGGGCLRPLPPLKTVYNFQVDSTLDVGSSALLSRPAVAHPVVYEWSAHQRPYRPTWVTSARKGSRWNFVGWVEGGWRGRLTCFLGVCGRISISDFPHPSVFDWVLALLGLRGGAVPQRSLLE